MRTNREQTISSERVLSQMQGSFITGSGKVIPGKWPEGEMAPVIFDNRYKSYLPVFKEARPGSPRKAPEDTIKRVGKRKRYYVPYVVTFVKESNRIYFKNPFSPSRQWFIDLSEVATDIEEAYLLKVLESNAMIGVFVYYVGTDCKVIKFKCLAGATSPTEIVTWEGAAYCKSYYEAIASTFSALVSGFGDTVTLDLSHMPPDWGYVESWEEVGGGFSPALKCVSVWADPPEAEDLGSLHFELGALLLVQRRLGYYLENPDWPDLPGSYESFVYVDYLVVCLDGEWQHLGRVYDQVVAYGIGLTLLLNLDRGEWFYPGGFGYFKGDFISGLKKVWPIMNSNGVGVAGYWALWEYIYADTHYSTYYLKVYPDEFHDMYWWTPTNQRVAGPIRDHPIWFSGAGLGFAGDAPSIDGNGNVIRAMSKRVILSINPVGQTFQQVLSQYRIAGVHYEDDQTIPDVIFNPTLNPFGRVSIEMMSAAAKIGLNFVPAHDVVTAEINRSRQLVNPNPIPAIYEVTIEVSCLHSFWWNPNKPSMGGTSRYEVVYPDYYGYPTRLPDPIKYSMNPNIHNLVGRPHATKLSCCGFIYGTA